MAKKEAKIIEAEAVEATKDYELVTPKISPLTEQFSNGEVNILRDKINEIIARS